MDFSEIGVNTIRRNCLTSWLYLLFPFDAHRMLATGHPDARVRIWDTRTKGETLTKTSLSSHVQWITSVAWAPGSETMVTPMCMLFQHCWVMGRCKEATKCTCAWNVFRGCRDSFVALLVLLNVAECFCCGVGGTWLNCSLHV